MWKTFNYIVIIIIIDCLTVSNLQAQTENDTATQTVSLMSGVRVELDLLSPLTQAAGASKGYYYQGAVALNLKETFFPTLEVGYGGINSILSVSGMSFRGKGFFARIGMDYNMLGNPKPRSAMNNLFVVGVRIGGSVFPYTIENIMISDSYWQRQTVTDFQRNAAFFIWYEVLAGLRVEVYNNIFMGWNVRMKGLFAAQKQNEIYPYFIPGLGLYKDSKWEFNYTLGWQF